MPFVLNIAPLRYRKVINTFLQPYLVVVYVDEILVYSETVETLEKYLRLLFDKLESVEINSSSHKCTFAMTEIKVLGHIVSSKGLKPASEKVIAAKNCFTGKYIYINY